ncbi:hypothetical protein D9758_017106 [Tetrapyrgos nigripes]|uniref:Uncharacterized protein n=1 Tax=Tetrapyrgos nigripes TaxID=182062 RepID=A0A8H5C399_9AGAR|nr:hypothetical protein D9758_017106 [Tetrapyrgos nigripes]
MALPDGDYYIQDHFNDFVTANSSTGSLFLTPFAGNDNQQVMISFPIYRFYPHQEALTLVSPSRIQWTIIRGQGVAQLIRNAHYQLYIQSSQENTSLTNSPFPWYINETTDTDWYQLSRSSNQGGPYWVDNGKGVLTVTSGGWYSFFFLPIQLVDNNTTSMSALPTSLMNTTASSPKPTFSDSATNPDSATDGSGPGPNIGAIVGGVVGGVVLLALIGVLWFKITRRRVQAKSGASNHSAQSPSTLTAFTLQEPTMSVVSNKRSTLVPSTPVTTCSPPPYSDVS